MKSAIYTGRLHHRRLMPKVHDFSYEIALFYIDLDELKERFSIPFLFSLRRPFLAGFKRTDYLKGNPSLKEAVREFIFEQTKKVSKGPIRLLTQIRYLGFCFNPVSFYYCFDETDSVVEYIITEITNTPWNERRAYVFETKFKKNDETFKVVFPKDFHISPFMKMELLHDWTFNQPKIDSQEALWVHMKDWKKRDSSLSFTASEIETFQEKKLPGNELQNNAFKDNAIKDNAIKDNAIKDNAEVIFTASLHIKPKPMTRENILLTLIQYPFLTFKSFIGIYFQAFILFFIKKIPFYSHPNSKS